jgi:hypothetical protein
MQYLAVTERDHVITSPAPAWARADHSFCAINLNNYSIGNMIIMYSAFVCGDPRLYG